MALLESFRANGRRPGTERFSNVPRSYTRGPVALIVNPGMSPDDAQLIAKRRYGKGVEVRIIREDEAEEGLPLVRGLTNMMHVLPPDQAREFNHIDSVAPRGGEEFVILSAKARETAQLIEHGVS